MKFFLLVFLGFFVGHLYAQQPCHKKSKVFRFDPHVHPWVFTEKLGNHPQFPFLQYEKGINSRALFVKAAKDPDSRKNYKKEFEVFNELLREIGFRNGYKDLKADNIENLYVNPGTPGNLGFYNPDKEGNNYIYVRLRPAGEDADGVAAWKLTGPSGCYIYILHTCGNAFYPNDPEADGDCCKAITIETPVTPVEVNASPVDRPLHIRIDFYQAKLFASKKHKGRSGGYDTLVSLIRSIDTVTLFKDTVGRRLKVYAPDGVNKAVVCRDTVLTIHIPLLVDSSAHQPDSVKYTLSDTSYVIEHSGKLICQKKWEIAADGGIAYNTVPTFNNSTEHTRPNGGHIAGEFAISRIFSQWFQLGVSASYIILSYQDDVPYPGSVAGIYNSVYLGKPIIPVQLFGKFTIGGPLGWQSNVSFSAGASIPANGEITTSGNALSTKPALKVGPTAGFKLGIAYFFSCKFGLAASFSGQYFNNSGATMNYNLIALPITGGIRFRF